MSLISVPLFSLIHSKLVISFSQIISFSQMSSIDLTKSYEHNLKQIKEIGNFELIGKISDSQLRTCLEKLDEFRKYGVIALKHIEYSDKDKKNVEVNENNITTMFKIMNSFFISGYDISDSTRDLEKFDLKFTKNNETEKIVRITFERKQSNG